MSHSVINTQTPKQNFLMLFLYNILFPLIFLLFVPGLVIKLIRRPGHKSSFLERFAIFSKEKKQKLFVHRGAIWIHSVSVGETVIALSLIQKWTDLDPSKKFVLSTTTTTGQELAQQKAPKNVVVIFCPIDFILFVMRTMSLVKPSLLVIFETEIWPNLIGQASRSGVKLAMVNARLSDNSVKGYTRFKRFLAPILEKVDRFCVQSQMDKERFASLSSKLTISAPGNLKFDQVIPSKFQDANLGQYFGDGDYLVLLAASTHPGEEALIARQFMKLKDKIANLRLVIVPRHAERWADIANELAEVGITFRRKTTCGTERAVVDCLLADTTGEMLTFINASDVVIMGKSLAGHDEGHNLIEPALLSKAIITGSKLSNFRFVLDILKSSNAIVTVTSDESLYDALSTLLGDEQLRIELGEKALGALAQHSGATERVIADLQAII